MATILNNRNKSKIVHVKAINEEALQQFALEEGFDPDMFIDVENDYLDDEADESITPELSREIDLLVAALTESEPEPVQVPEVKPRNAWDKHEAGVAHKHGSHESNAPASEVKTEEATPEILEEPPQHEKPKPTMKQRLLKIPYKKRIAAILAVELVLMGTMGDNIFMTVELRNQLERQEAKAAVAAEAVAANVLPVIPSSTGKIEKAGTEKVNEMWIETIRDKAANLEYVEAERDYDIENSETYKLVQGSYNWDGRVLSRGAGTVTGPNGKETYYNLNMSIIMRMMNARGVYDPYWVRSDGCKMIGNYIMVAADLDLHPRGSIVKTSLGLAMVCDTGSFTKHNRQQIDVAVSW